MARVAVITFGSETKADLAKAPARVMYRGRMTARIVREVDEMRKRGLDVDLYIMSPKHGLLKEDDEVENYNVAWSAVDLADLAKRSWPKVEAVIKSHDLTVFVSNRYIFEMFGEEACSKYKDKVLFLYGGRDAAEFEECVRPTKAFDKHQHLREVLGGLLADKKAV